MGGGVGKMLGGGYLWEFTFWGTHGVRPYGTRDEGALLSLNSHLSPLLSHLYSFQERFFIHDFYAEFLRPFEF